MTNDEIKNRCRELVRITKTDEELKEKIREEFGMIPAIASTESCGMRMVMGMLFNKYNGSSISF